MSGGEGKDQSVIGRQTRINSGGEWMEMIVYFQTHQTKTETHESVVKLPDT